MKAKYLIMLMVIFLSLTTLIFAQQPAGAKIWFSPQKATTYNVTMNYNLILGSQDPVEPIIVNPLSTKVTTNWSIDPPIKFCIAAQATRLIQFRVILTYDSQKINIEPANFSTSMVGIALTATAIQPGKIEVEGLTLMDAASPLNADKSLFQINLPPKAVPAEPVTLQGAVDALIVDSAVSISAAETASVVVKAVAKTMNQNIYVGDADKNGSLDINDLLYAARQLNQSMTPAGTVYANNLGDWSENGVVDIVDALSVAQYVVGFNCYVGTYSRFLGDVDFNGTLNIVDAMLVARYANGLIDNF